MRHERGKRNERDERPSSGRPQPKAPGKGDGRAPSRGHDASRPTKPGTPPRADHGRPTAGPRPGGDRPAPRDSGRDSTRDSGRDGARDSGRDSTRESGRDTPPPPVHARPGEVVVDGYSERWVRRGFPWVYPKEVRGGELRPGAEVVVRTLAGEALGRGIADRGWLAVRIFRHDTGPLDRAFFAARIAEAQALRDVLLGSGADPRATNGYRIANAENDGLPGIRIDRWGDHLVIALDTPALAVVLPLLVEVLAARYAPTSIHLCYRPDVRDTHLGEVGAFDPPAACIFGTAPEAGAAVVCERGLRFGVQVDEGPDVGLYADMRQTRAWLEPHWRGTRVLNTFAYTGAFSVAAAAHGAARVVTLDLSEKYLARAAANFALNDLAVDAAEFVADDVFRALDRLRRKGEQFDRVILDPPSFSHSEEGKWSADRDYPRLVAAACRVLAPGGWLIAASNLGELSPHKFREPIDEGIRKAERLAQELYFGGQSPDFPAAMWFPEGRYLKVGVWRIL